MTDASSPRAHHDLGGVSPFMCLEVDRSPHALTDFDKQVDAVRQLVARRGLMSVDELRRGIEALPAADYDRLSYYQRWLRSIVATLVGKGVMTEAELQAQLDRS